MTPPEPSRMRVRVPSESIQIKDLHNQSGKLYVSFAYTQAAPYSDNARLIMGHPSLNHCPYEQFPRKT